jgi:2-polyprenyl-3-methyl-5-hydroxy-6-metoxy-1,4-benzoquinol methylase
MARADDHVSNYAYHDAAPTHSNGYLWKPLRQIVEKQEWASHRAFDLGCGNGATCKFLSSLGFETIGIDSSERGVAHAKSAGVNAHVGSAYDDLAAVYGTFPLVVSLEVIEHCIDPRRFTKTFLSLIEPGGIGVLSTPFHGYWKNIALAISGKMDGHYTALWDGGHVKFFSIKTLGELLRETGAEHIDFRRVGRIPPLAKSMIAVVRG